MKNKPIGYIEIPNIIYTKCPNCGKRTEDSASKYVGKKPPLKLSCQSCKIEFFVNKVYFKPAPKRKK